MPLISHQFVFKYINEMKGNKSTGHDDMSARFKKFNSSLYNRFNSKNGG